MKVLILAILFCASSVFARLEIGEWIPITESQPVTEAKPEWHDDCADKLENIFKDKDIIEDDNLAVLGEKEAKSVLDNKQQKPDNTAVVFWRKYYSKSKKKGCKTALGDFKTFLDKKDYDEKILGCGFASGTGKGFAFVCLKETEPDMKLRLGKTVTSFCQSKINELYYKENLEKDAELEDQALSASHAALNDGNCKNVDANRCKVIKNLVSLDRAFGCGALTDGINPKEPKRIGCKFVQKGNGALTCVIEKIGIQS